MFAKILIRPYLIPQILKITTTTELKINALNPYMSNSSNYSNKTLKEEIEILDKDKTQTDISRS